MAFGFVGLPGGRYHSPVDQKLSPAYPEEIREVIADVSKGTGFALLIQHEEAIMDADRRTEVRTMLELMRRWPTDPIGAGNLLAFFSRTRN